MPYNALGDYVPGDEEPSLDAMRLAVEQKAEPAYTRIPTHGYHKAPAATHGAASPAKSFRDVATDLNPLMLMKALQEGVGATVVNPVVGALQGVATELQTPEFWNASRTKPTGIAEQVATDFMQRNAPTTPLAQAFTEGVSKYTQDLPAYLGHLSTNRPALTPNDVRVLGAEATRLGRQVRDIPSDFANAQAGVQRIDPITGEPTLGARLQAGAESLGDTMARREAQGLSPVPGVPAAFQPETKMHAVRPAGTRLVTPQVPPTKDLGDLSFANAPQRLLNQEVADNTGRTLSTDQIENRLEQERIARNISSADFERWALNKAHNMYPTAPSADDALNAWKATFSNPNALAKEQLAWLEEYLATPEGKASPMAQLPTPTQIQDRHAAALQWLHGPLTNYIVKHVGAVGDPALKLAMQGITYDPAAVVLESAADLVDVTNVQERRRKAGMPIEGEVAPLLKAKQEELSAAQADLTKWQTRRQAYRDIAEQQGLLDPAMLPDYAATTAPIRELTRNVDKLEEEVKHLQLGKAYEDLSDYAVQPYTPAEAMRHFDFPQQQFYPAITRAKPNEMLYTATTPRRLGAMGLGQLAQDLYNDVLSGAIPIEQLSKLPVEKYIREKAIPRIKQEKQAALAQKEYKVNAEKVMKQTLDDNAAPENYFGNIGVIELSKKNGLTPEQNTKILSEATTVLDHCIAQGGDAGRRADNLWIPGSKRRYEPIYDIVTGERNPRATRDISTYASSIADAGTVIADIRDRNTGIPVATLELSRSHTLPDGTPRYYVGWASGAHNGAVDSKYQAAIKEYLNAKADVIESPGSKIEQNIGLYDTQTMAPVDLLRNAGVARSKASQVDLSSLPRFVTADDVRHYVNAILDAQQEQPTTQPVVARPTGFDIAQVNRDITTAIDNAVQLAYDDFNMATSDIVRDQILRALPTNRLTDVTTPADMQALLRDGISLLTEQVEMAALATSQRMQDASGPISEFLTDLRGIAHAIDRNVYTQEPAQVVNQQTTPASMFRDFIDTVGQEDGVQVADRVETVAINAAERVSPNGSVMAAMHRRPAQFAQELRRLAQDEDSELVEMALHRLADEISDRQTPPQTEPAPGGREAQQRFEIGDFDAYIQRVNRDVGFTEADRLVRVANTIARDMGSDTVRLALENRPTQFAERLAAAANHEEDAQLQDVLFQLADEIAPPIRDLNEPLPDLFPELPGQQAQPLNVQDVAFELFQDTRRGEGRDLDELRTTLQALDNGNFDDMRFRALPAEQRDRAQRDVAHQIRAIMDDLNITLPAEPQAQPTQAQRAILDSLEGTLQIAGVDSLNNQLLAMTRPSAYWSGLSPEQLQTAITRTQNRIRELEQQQQQQQQQQEVARYQPIADRVNEMTYDQLRTALTPGELGEVSALHDDIARSNYTPDQIRRIAQMVYDHQMSQWEQFDDAQRAMLYMELTYTANRMEQEPSPRRRPEGHANGGLIRGYQAGGQVSKYPGLFGLQGEAIERAQEMYPSEFSQDDQADAARHMLASGYAAQSVGPTLAKGLGWMHEFKDAPLRTMGHALGLSNPRYDYNMDMHNNALGIELAQKAKDRADFERMVQQSVQQGTTTTQPGRARLMTPEQAKAGRGMLKYANGGTLSQTPSLDEMQLELQSRSK